MAIAIVLAGAGFALLFGFIFTSDAATSGQGGPPPSTDDRDRQHRCTPVASAWATCSLLTIGVLTRSASEYRHKTITATFLATPKRVQAMLAKVVALLVIGAIYGLRQPVGSVVVGRGRPHPARPGRRSRDGDRSDAGAEPPRARPVGAHRSRHRHPHPQPGRRPAHRRRCRVDRRAAPRASHDALGLQPRARGTSSCPSSGDQRRINAIPRTPRRGQAGVVGRCPALMAYAALLAGFGIWRTTRADIS